MKYQFNDVAAVAIIDIIKTTKVVHATLDKVYYSNEVCDNWPDRIMYSYDKESRVMRVSYSSFCNEHFLEVGEDSVSLSYFGWGNRRKILNAVRATKAAFVNSERRAEEKRRADAAVEVLNSIMNKVSGAA